MSSKLDNEVRPHKGNKWGRPAPRQWQRFKLLLLAICALAAYCLLDLLNIPLHRPIRSTYRPANAERILARCCALPKLPSPPPGFADRKQSDRFEPGTPPTLITHATLWLGDDRVLEHAELYMDGGVIRGIGQVPKEMYEDVSGVVVVDVQGAWVTPGLVDMHSHIGVGPAPRLRGAIEADSLLGPIQPWLRSIDGINTHDLSYALSVSGGVTSALVLPGSEDNIGGQAFVIKLRKTKERSSSSMLVEPPYGLWNGSDVDPDAPIRWRHTKHACGEEPAKAFHGTRMDNVWRFRQAYAAAAAIRDAQDAYCGSALSGDWLSIKDKPFPYDLKLEALVDTLRGKVKVHVHCYEAVDFDGMVRLTNEYKFPIAAFHHAHEAYLVPDLLKKTWGGAPAIAMFAIAARYKREAYRGSEFAPKFLSENGIPVVMKSDHPLMDSRHLLYEAQQAYLYGLNASLALAAVTSTPSETIGLSHRLGALKVGHDADVVVWDSHPLQLGATPLQVYIDGIAQLAYRGGDVIDGGVTHKSLQNRRVPNPQMQTQPDKPDYSKETQEAVAFDGEPPLGPREVHTGEVLFTEVLTLWRSDESGDLQEEFLNSDPSHRGVEVLVRNGSIVCSGKCRPVAEPEVRIINLEGGSLAPGLTTYGSRLGLAEIGAEPSTIDGVAYDVFGIHVAPSVLGRQPQRAVDGIQFGGRDMLMAHRSGVTTAITAPISLGFLAGLSGAFATSAWNKAEKGSIVQPVTALHVAMGHRSNGPAISAQVAALRHLLASAKEGEVWWDAAHGLLPLVIAVHSADIMSTLILLKHEIELQYGSRTRWTFAGANEAWMVAKNIAGADIGVILTPSRTYPGEWEKMRTLPGHPLTEDTNTSVLLAHNVTLAIGVTEEPCLARNTRFDAIWLYRDGHGKISKSQALEMVSSNVNKLLGLDASIVRGEYVAYHGGDFFSMAAKVVATVSEARGLTALL